MSGYMSPQDAATYWAGREFKKFVVELESGPKNKPEREVKYVRARTREGAIRCARANAFRIKSPRRVSCRLATAFDLGCTHTDTPTGAAING